MKKTLLPGLFFDQFPLSAPPASWATPRKREEGRETTAALD